MKVPKFQFAALALLLTVSILYGVAYVSASQNYYSSIELPDDTDLGKMFADPQPFLYAKQGQPFFMAGIVLSILWCFAIYPPNHWRRKANKIVALMLLLSVSLMVFQVRPVHAQEWININVLCAGDEEFMSEANRAGVELAIDRANTLTVWWLNIVDCFEETFNIHFEIVGWISWDSNDAQTIAEYMASEVLTDTGFESGMEYNGQIVHMLFACTGQDIYGYDACTFPNAHLTLMESFYAQHGAPVRHELSHQFHTPECSANTPCVMNEADATSPAYAVWNWCDECKDWINAHKFKYTVYTLTIQTGTGGTTNPSSGTYPYYYGSSVIVKALPSTDYEFDYWILDGATKYGDEIAVTMNSDHTLKAYFEYSDGGGGGGGCPTLFVWDGEEYAEEGILDIHACSDVTVQHWIQNTLALENGVYKAQLRELDNYTSHIDQVRLYVVDGEGEWHSCPITYAYHNELGKVKQTLRFDDGNRVDLKPTEIIDLKFGQPIPYSETEYFIFEINGYNLKPLMEAW